MMITAKDLLCGADKLSLVGLGYVGMPIAVAFSKHVGVIGYDVNEEKIQTYQKGIDPTKEVGDEAVQACTVAFTSDEGDLRGARFHIVAVPTPVRADKTPDLSPLMGASRAVGRQMQPGSIVVFESTVYPGVTEDVCVPLLEEESGLRCGVDFKVGYSPERINPGDREHRLESIVKVVSGMDEEALQTIAEVYSLVVQAGVHRASSIRVAEAAKVIENSQRDINIAFMNELSLIFDKMGIDTLEVLKAAETKWNFLGYRPGLVGGHCIGVDPYYLTYAAERFGYRSEVILAGRRINDNMGGYVAQRAVRMMALNDIPIKGARVAVLGFTFKENCPDTRNTRVVDILGELRGYGVKPLVFDPVADEEEMLAHYGIVSCGFEELKELDAAIIAVAHDGFRSMNVGGMLSKNGVVLDIKGVTRPPDGHAYWRL